MGIPLKVIRSTVHCEKNLTRYAVLEVFFFSNPCENGKKNCWVEFYSYFSNLTSNEVGKNSLSVFFVKMASITLGGFNYTVFLCIISAKKWYGLFIYKMMKKRLLICITCRILCTVLYHILGEEKSCALGLDSIAQQPNNSHLLFKVCMWLFLQVWSLEILSGVENLLVKCSLCNG